MAYLDKQMEGAVPPGKGEEWTPLIAYRNSLAQQGDIDYSMAPPARPGARGRGRGAKRKIIESLGAGKKLGLHASGFIPDCNPYAHD